MTKNRLLAFSLFFLVNSTLTFSQDLNLQNITPSSIMKKGLEKVILHRLIIFL